MMCECTRSMSLKIYGDLSHNWPRRSPQKADFDELWGSTRPNGHMRSNIVLLRPSASIIVLIRQKNYPCMAHYRAIVTVTVESSQSRNFVSRQISDCYRKIKSMTHACDGLIMASTLILATWDHNLSDGCAYISNNGQNTRDRHLETTYLST